MTIILGIDPGSRSTGYGVIAADGKSTTYLASGCIRSVSPQLSERLQHIFLGMQQIIDTYKPEEIAIEQVFVHRNVNSALQLGQARGAAIVAAAQMQLPVSEYSARQIKQSVVGYGAAKKEQVQHMVRFLLKLTGIPKKDASDALAIALCHVHSRRNIVRLITQQTRMRGRYRRGRIR